MIFIIVSVLLVTVLFSVLALKNKWFIFASQAHTFYLLAI